MAQVYLQKANADTSEGVEVEILLRHTVDTWVEECHGYHNMSSQETEIIGAWVADTGEECNIPEVELSKLLRKKCTHYYDSYPECDECEDF